VSFAVEEERREWLEIEIGGREERAQREQQGLMIWAKQVSTTRRLRARSASW
jgi:hypothetical protein